MISRTHEKKSPERRKTGHRVKQNSFQVKRNKRHFTYQVLSHSFPFSDKTLFLPATRWQLLSFPLRWRSFHKAYFLSQPVASKHCVFPLTEVSASKVPAILPWKKPNIWLGGFHFEGVLGSQAVFMWRHSVQLKLLVGSRKTCSWLGILYKVSKIYFFPTDYPFHYLHFYHFWGLELVWLKIVQLRNSHNLEWW